MTEPDALLDRVGVALDALREAGQEHDGLIPSVLHRDSGEMYCEIPGRIQAQRDPDRSHFGSNLLYDVPLLATMYGFADAGEGQEYADAADAYVEEFATHCTDTATGIFPWGDHAYWNLAEDRVGVSGEFHPNGYPDADEAVHDHNGRAPRWLWSRIQDENPDAVQRFADGLDYHWISDLQVQFDRHAWITKRDRQAWDPKDSGCDFPRHAGLYVFDLAVAYSYEQRPETRAQLQRFLDYWWDKREYIEWWEEMAVLPAETYGRPVEPALNQTRSTAVSFLEAATILDDVAPDIAATARSRGETYLAGVLDAESASAADADSADSLWGGGGPYGGKPLARFGLLYLCGWRHGAGERAFDRATEIGSHYLDADPPTDGLLTVEEAGLSIFRGNSKYVDADERIPLSANDAGLVVEFLADLYDVTGDEEWRDRGLEIAGTFSEAFFDEAPLPRGAAGIDWYESELGTGTLLHSLARIALLARDGKDSVGPDYVHR